MIKTEKQKELAKRSSSATLFRLDSFEERTKEIVLSCEISQDVDQVSLYKY